MKAGSRGLCHISHADKVKLHWVSLWHKRNYNFFTLLFGNCCLACFPLQSGWHIVTVLGRQHFSWPDSTSAGPFKQLMLQYLQAMSHHLGRGLSRNLYLKSSRTNCSLLLLLQMETSSVVLKLPCVPAARWSLCRAGISVSQSLSISI